MFEAYFARAVPIERFSVVFLVVVQLLHAPLLWLNWWDLCWLVYSCCSGNVFFSICLSSLFSIERTRLLDCLFCLVSLFLTAINWKSYMLKGGDGWFLTWRLVTASLQEAETCTPGHDGTCAGLNWCPRFWPMWHLWKCTSFFVFECRYIIYLQFVSFFSLPLSWIWLFHAIFETFRCWITDTG